MTHPEARRTCVPPIVPDESSSFLSTVAPTPLARRIALSAAIVSTLVFLAVLPFAQVQLPPVVAFVSIYQSAIVTNDLITSALLLGQFAIQGTVSLAALGAGFLLAALFAGVHLLTFPGMFAPAGALGAGPQTTAWLYMVWHAAYALGLIVYTQLGRSGNTPTWPVGRRGWLVGGIVAGALLCVAGTTVLATAGHALLPAIMNGNVYTTAMVGVVSGVIIVNAVALAALWWRRPHTVLDLWLMLATLSVIFEVALAAVFNAGRFDLGFYAGRIYGLAASLFVLIMLLLENSVLYARLVRATTRERDEFRRAQRHSAEVNELNATLEQRVAERTAAHDTINRELRVEIAHREEAEAHAREARERLDSIIDSAMDAIVTVDDAQEIVLFNSAAERMFGYPQAEALGTPLLRLLPDRYRGAHAGHVRQFGQGGERSRRMARARIVTGLRRSGQEFPIDASISQVDLGGRKYFTIILRDVTDRIEAEEALRRSKDELHEVAQVGATAREQEKQRIARELHDELAQSLAMLGMDLNWLRTRLPGDDASMTKIAAMQNLLSGTVAATRRIAADLRPLVLDDLGLVAAAQWLVEKFRERHGIGCTITIEPAQMDIADPYATAVFRILQEALANVGKHAQATNVSVALRQADGRIRLVVGDNGTGFDLGLPRKAASFGLVGLRERARLVAGDLTVRSKPGEGTQIDVDIPLSEPLAGG